MKKIVKKLSTLLAILVFSATLGVNVHAATTKAYTISDGYTAVYRTESLTGSKYGTIYPWDELILLGKYGSSLKVSYPTNSGSKIGFISYDSVFVQHITSRSDPTRWATRKITTYKRPNTNSEYGWIDYADKITVMGNKDGFVQVEYPSGSNKKIAFIRYQDYSNYLTTRRLS